MRQDAQAALRSELDRLIDNANSEDQDYFSNEFNSFANLFERFLQARGPSIDWDRIKPPAEGMVRVQQKSSIIFTSVLRNGYQS